MSALCAPVLRCLGLSELDEKPRLLIGYMVTRRKDGSPFQKSPVVPHEVV
jgi:hypothetical protein